MRILIVAAMAAGALAACSPGDTRKVAPEPAAVAPTPSDSAIQTFAGCTWGEVKGAAWSMWSFACGPQFGDIRLVADDALPGFVIEGATPAERRVVVQIFDKPADAGLDAILPTVRALSPGLGTSTCVFEPLTDAGKEGLFAFAPTGVLKQQYDAENFSDTVPAMPCGPLGVGPAGERVFKVVDGHPGKVAYIDYGSEIQIFDAGTLKAVAAH